MTHLRFALLIAAIPSLAYAQEIAFGLRAGVPFTVSVEEDNRNPTVSSPIRRYTVGLGGEMRFSNRLAFSVDGLYKRVGYYGTYACGLRCQPQVLSISPSIVRSHISDTVHAAGNSWEFPLLAKFLFGVPAVGGGVSIRRISSASLHCLSRDSTFGSGVPGGPVTATTEQPCVSDLPSRWFAGLVASGGLELGHHRLRVIPELRYTRWLGTDPWDDVVLFPSQSPRFAANQVEILLGFMF
jgi:hypothetical protein